MSQKQEISTSSEKISNSLPIFVLCDRCYWCATFLNKARISRDNLCPECATLNKFSSFPILPNESFTFEYTDKRGVELEFKNRK
jgi:phage FluMu protein Com